MAQVKITVTNGKLAIEGVGYSGPACEKDVEFFAKTLGGEEREAHHTLEYDNAPATEQTQENQ